MSSNKTLLKINMAVIVNNETQIKRLRDDILDYFMLFDPKNIKISTMTYEGDELVGGDHVTSIAEAFKSTGSDCSSSGQGSAILAIAITILLLLLLLIALFLYFYIRFAKFADLKRNLDQYQELTQSLMRVKTVPSPPGFKIDEKPVDYSNLTYTKHSNPLKHSTPERKAYAEQPLYSSVYKSSDSARNAGTMLQMQTFPKVIDDRGDLDDLEDHGHRSLAKMIGARWTAATGGASSIVNDEVKIISASSQLHDGNGNGSAKQLRFLLAASHRKCSGTSSSTPSDSVSTVSSSDHVVSARAISSVGRCFQQQQHQKQKQQQHHDSTDASTDSAGSFDRRVQTVNDVIDSAFNDLISSIHEPTGRNRKPSYA